MKNLNRVLFLAFGLVTLSVSGLKAQDALKVTANPVHNSAKEFNLTITPFNSVNAGYLHAMALGDNAFFAEFIPNYEKNEFFVKLNQDATPAQVESKVASEIQRAVAAQNERMQREQKNSVNPSQDAKPAERADSPASTR